MADTTDMRTILHIGKSLNLQEQGVAVIQASPRMTKTDLEAALKEYFGVAPRSINSLKTNGKVKRFRRHLGQRNDYKKSYVKLPEGVSLEGTEA